MLNSTHPLNLLSTLPRSEVSTWMTSLADEDNTVMLIAFTDPEASNIPPQPWKDKPDNSPCQTNSAPSRDSYSCFFGATNKPRSIVLQPEHSLESPFLFRSSYPHILAKKACLVGSRGDGLILPAACPGARRRSLAACRLDLSRPLDHSRSFYSDSLFCRSELKTDIA